MNWRTANNNNSNSNNEKEKNECNQAEYNIYDGMDG